MKKLSLLMITSLIIQFNFSQWTPTPGLYTGIDSATIVYSIKGFGTDVYACSNKGLFKTTDYGVTWNDVSYTLPVIGGESIRSVLVAGNGDMYSGSDRRLYKSTDNGTSWSWLNTITDSLSFNSITEIGGNIVVSYSIGFSTGGTYFSSNGGTSWNASTGLVNLPMYYFLLDGTTLYLGGKNGVYKSMDNGQSWTTAGTGFPATCGPRTVVKSNGVFFAADVGGNGLFASYDNAASWINVDTSVFTPFCQVFSIVESNGTIIATMDGVCNSNDPVKSSIDTGSTWNIFMTGLPNNFYPTLGRNEEGSCFYIFNNTESKIYRMCNAVGIENNPTINIRVYPNPSTETIYISDVSDGHYNLMDLSGKSILSGIISQDNTSINISSLTTGIYLLRIYTEGRMITKKLIKT